ncbi:MAG: Stp1/IreP family PP2C-type Ser/Thr phosphatase [Lachnospiraceae bacterium]|nr:Stp1/IreP family PP2C-type Ser/Thr phosphatase [Lachnospiraceae bacterium]
MVACALTDRGRKRENNQDSICCVSTPVGNLPNLFIVADGMGGHQGGEFASAFVIEAVVNAVREDTGNNPITIMNRALQKANKNLYEQSLSSPSLEGMGTTLVLACVEGETLYVSNIGDSRLYIINEEIRQITRDHSLVEELVLQGKMERGSETYLEQKNIITRAMGIKDQVTVDFFEVELEKGDILLLCSDGLSNMLEDEEIRDIVWKEEDFTSLPGKLVEAANNQGGRDNISVVLVKPE